MSPRLVRSTVVIGRVFGIPIGLHVSWFLSAALITGLLGIEVFPEIFPEHEGFTNWSLSALTALLFFTSILLHELAHSVVAIRAGIPVKSITLFIFGGVSQISREATRARTEFLIAFVGPLTSLVLAVLLFGGWMLIPTDEETPLTVMVEILMVMNAALGIFNFLPAFPMDGGRLARALLWGTLGNYIRATKYAALLSRGLAYGMMVLGVLTVLELEWLPLDLDQLSGAWLILVGLFIESSARTGYAQVRLIESLKLHNVDELMTRDIAVISSGLALDNVVEAYMTRQGKACLFVADDQGTVTGVVTPQEVRKIPRGKWTETRAGDVMLAVTAVPVVTSSSDVATTLQRMETDNLFQMPVVDEGRLIGLIDRVHILQLIQKLRTAGRA